jgi:ADP-ribose pyrophosphatase YjhB (NUDIX family)
MTEVNIEPEPNAGDERPTAAGAPTPQHRLSAADNWATSYHGKVRAAMGTATLFFIGARGVIRDEQGRIFLIKRADNGHWAFPAGGMELGESLTDCAIRETYEETGLKAGRGTLFAFLSGPHYTFTNVFGDTYQHISASVLLEDLTGEVDVDSEEASDWGWFAPESLPAGTSRVVFFTLEHLMAYENSGKVVID